MVLAACVYPIRWWASRWLGWPHTTHNGSLAHNNSPQRDGKQLKKKMLNSVVDKIVFITFIIQRTIVIIIIIISIMYKTAYISRRDNGEKNVKYIRTADGGKVYNTCRRSTEEWWRRTHKNSDRNNNTKTYKYANHEYKKRLC